MESEIFTAASNPAMANEIVKQLMEEEQQVTMVGVTEALTPAPLPPDTSVRLPGGLLDVFTGELTDTAEVRELNGVDEEALAKITDVGKSLLAILARGVVKIGDQPATAEVLDDLLAGDRELLLVAIRRVTFGNEVVLQGSCPECSAPDQEFRVNLTEDLEVKRLENQDDRRFTVECKVGPVSVLLPTGHTQIKLLKNASKTIPELDTILLKDCIETINGMPILDVKQILVLGIADRRKITTEIAKRAIGPRLDDIKKLCSACGQEVPIPLTVADLFRI